VKGAPAPAKPAPKLANAAGFTLLEMLLALGVMALVLGGAASALESMTKKDRTQGAARDLVSMIREARHLAMRENTPVRLAFLPEGRERLWLGSGSEETSRMGCAILVLRRPALKAVTGMLTRPTAALEGASSLQEAAPSARVPLPEDLLAGWEFADSHGRWSLWPDGVRMHGSLISTYEGDGFDVAKQSFLWQSAVEWSQTAPHHDTPSGLALTPVKATRRLSMKSLDEADQRAREHFGSAALLRWVSPENGEEEVLKSLPALDFLPNGLPACHAQEKRVIFDFVSGDQQRDLLPETRVVLDSQTGEAWIE
jgi:prepilin-type N-terminal cleavage/methylation domain-containing protein